MSMQRMLLLKSQANEVFIRIAESGMEPNQFRWKEVASRFGSQIVSQLEHRTSGFYYVFDFKDGHHFLTCTPGESSPIRTEYPGAWHVQLQYVKDWLKTVKREVEAPDFWAELSKEEQLAGLSEQADNSPFTAKEVKVISTRINELTNEIKKSYALTDPQFKFIKIQLERLSDSADRLGRKDWLMFGAGVLFNIAYDLAKTPQAREIVSYIARSIFDLVQHIPQLIHKTGA